MPLHALVEHPPRRHEATSARRWTGLALWRFVDAIGSEGLVRLPRSLHASHEQRAAAIGRLHLRADGELLEELLIEFEEEEWARQAAIEELEKQG